MKCDETPCEDKGSGRYYDCEIPKAGLCGETAATESRGKADYDQRLKCRLRVCHG